MGFLFLSEWYCNLALILRTVMVSVIVEVTVWTEYSICECIIG